MQSCVLTAVVKLLKSQITQIPFSFQVRRRVQEFQLRTSFSVHGVNRPLIQENDRYSTSQLFQEVDKIPQNLLDKLSNSMKILQHSPARQMRMKGMVNMY